MVTIFSSQVVDAELQMPGQRMIQGLNLDLPQLQFLGVGKAPRGYKGNGGAEWLWALAPEDAFL